MPLIDKGARTMLARSIAQRSAPARPRRRIDGRRVERVTQWSERHADAALQLTSAKRPRSQAQTRASGRSCLVVQPIQRSWP